MIRYAIFYNKEFSEDYPEDFLLLYKKAKRYCNASGYVTPSVVIGKYDLEDFIKHNPKLHKSFDIGVFIGDINSDPVCEYALRVCNLFKKAIIIIGSESTPIERLTKEFLDSKGEKKLITLCSRYGVDYHTVEQEMAEYLFSLVKEERR